MARNHAIHHTAAADAIMSVGCGFSSLTIRRQKAAGLSKASFVERRLNCTDLEWRWRSLIQSIAGFLRNVFFVRCSVVDEISSDSVLARSIYGSWASCYIWPRLRQGKPVCQIPTYLEVKREYYQNCFVLYCVLQLWTTVCTRIWPVLKLIFS